MTYWTETMIRDGLDKLMFPKPEPKEEAAPEPQHDIIRVASTPSPFKAVRIREIADAVASLTGVPFVELSSLRRNAVAIRARYIVYYVVRETTGYSLAQIGAVVKRDHSSILYGLQEVAKDRAYYEPELSIALNLFKTRDAAA